MTQRHSIPSKLHLKIKNNVFERGVKQNNIKLYVRKVFVSDNSAVLCPEWLHFISGVVEVFICKDWL